MLHDFETDGRYTPLLFKNIKNFQNILFPIRNTCSRNFCTVAPKQITRERVNISSLSAYERVGMFCLLTNLSPCSAVFRVGTAEVLLRRVIRWIDLCRKLGQSYR